MAELLPIFPLSLVVFPGETLNLHIFEQRYKDLVRECVEENKNFGIPSHINGRLCNYGTEVEIDFIERVYRDGEMDISTKGKRVFMIHKLEPSPSGKLYSSALVEWIETDINTSLELTEEIILLLKELHSLLKISKDKIGSPEGFNTYKVAHLVGFSLEDEYQFLTLLRERDRQLLMLDHLRKILPIARETEKLKERIQANGHFKNITPPTF